MKNQLKCHLTNDEQFMFKELEELLYSHRLTYLLLGRGTIFLKQVFFSFNFSSKHRVTVTWKWAEMKESARGWVLREMPLYFYSVSCWCHPSLKPICKTCLGHRAHTSHFVFLIMLLNQSHLCDYGFRTLCWNSKFNSR